MVLYQWMVMLFALIPMISIEAFVIGIRLESTWASVFVVVAIANGVSFLFGVPATFLVLACIQKVTGIRPGYSRTNRIFLAPWRVAGLVLFDATPKWFYSSALLSLLLPLFLASWLIEYPIVAGFLDATDWTAMNTRVFLANLASYGLLAVYGAWELSNASRSRSEWERPLGVWDSGREGKSLGPEISSLTVSPDGNVVAAGWEDTIRLWDRKTGKLLRILRGHEHGVTLIAFSPDGQRLASNAWVTEVFVWNWAKGKRTERLAAGVYLTSLTFSPDGKYLAAGSAEDNVFIWQTDTWKMVDLEGSFEDNVILGDEVDCVAFSPDNQHLAAKYNPASSDGGRVHLWSLETFNLARKLSLEDENYASVGHLAFSPNKPLVAITSSFGVSGEEGRSAIISIWNYEKDIKVSELESEGFWLGSLAFSSDGTHLASGCDDGKVRFWDIQSRKLTQEVKTQREDCTPSIKPLVEDKWLVFSKGPDGDLLMYELETGGSLSEPVVLGKG